LQAGHPTSNLQHPTLYVETACLKTEGLADRSLFLSREMEIAAMARTKRRVIMRVSHRPCLPISILSLSLAALVPAYASSDKAAKSPETPSEVQPPSDATYAQIVRVSYVEGDVRVMRGNQDERATEAIWEQAAVDLQLETGFSLVTGTGRAEIEFEDTSTLYLGENSVLTFNDLHTTAGVPFSEVALLAGTVTLHVRPYVRGEEFVVKTPTDDLRTRYPGIADIRISSYMDGIAITELNGGILRLPLLGGWVNESFGAGKTQFYRAGLRIDPVGADDPNAFDRWDKWVADRLAQRTAATAEMMKASGLTSPIPGLAELKGQGNFFDCAPYGTCWEPAAADGQQKEAGKLPESQPLSVGSPQQPAQTRNSVSGAQASATEHEIFFPCPPASIRYRTIRDPNTGKERVIDSRLVTNAAPYDWALCHAGTWLYRHNRYAWVVGHKRHHHEPVRWVKSGRTVAFVPIHPRDVKGKPPINGKQEIFAVRNKNGLSVERIRIDDSHPIELLKSPPREFRTAPLPPLARTDAPHMEAHQIRDLGAGSKVTLAKIESIPIGFDRKSQSFTMTRDVMQGDRHTTVMTPISNHDGSLQARAASFSGGGGSSGGGSHGGGNGGSSGGFSGGTSHSSGFSGSGGSSGGGSHGGSGGGGFSGGGGSSSAASSSSGSSASGGGSHR
jgi:hypothetical protein